MNLAQRSIVRRRDFHYYLPLAAAQLFSQPPLVEQMFLQFITNLSATYGIVRKTAEKVRTKARRDALRLTNHVTVPAGTLWPATERDGELLRDVGWARTKWPGARWRRAQPACVAALTLRRVFTRWPTTVPREKSINTPGPMASREKLCGVDSSLAPNETCNLQHGLLQDSAHLATHMGAPGSQSWLQVQSEPANRCVAGSCAATGRKGGRSPLGHCRGRPYI